MKNQQLNQNTTETSKERVLIEKDHIEWDHINTLRALEVPCTSSKNGQDFINRERLDKIEAILKENGDNYLVTHIGNADIYIHKNLYKDKNPNQGNMNDIILITAHCDTLPTEPFVKYNQETDILHGTFDNIICDTALTILMKENDLPSNIVIAFTGDEETGRCAGCRHVVKILKQNHFNITTAIALDVTYNGYRTANFSLENYANKDKAGSANKESAFYKAFETIKDGCGDYVTEANGMYDEGYALRDAGCTEWGSFCMPMEGSMHSNSGGYIKERSFEGYLLALTSFTYALTNTHPELIQEYKMMRDKYKPVIPVYTSSIQSYNSTTPLSIYDEYENEYGMSPEEFEQAREERIKEIAEFYASRGLDIPDEYLWEEEYIPTQYDEWSAYDILSNDADNLIADAEDADDIEEIRGIQAQFIDSWKDYWEIQPLFENNGFNTEIERIAYLKEIFKEALGISNECLAEELNEDTQERT